MSPTIDYMVLPEGLRDDARALIPEKLLLVPWAAFPYQPRVIDPAVAAAAAAAPAPG